MKILETKEDFTTLHLGVRITHLYRGESKHYTFVNTHPDYEKKNYFIVVSSADIMKAAIFEYPNEYFNKNDECWIINYDSNEVAKILVNQLKKRITTIKNIYK